MAPPPVSKRSPFAHARSNCTSLRTANAHVSNSGLPSALSAGNRIGAVSSVRPSPSDSVANSNDLLAYPKPRADYYPIRAISASFYAIIACIRRLLQSRLPCWLLLVFLPVLFLFSPAYHSPFLHSISQRPPTLSKPLVFAGKSTSDAGDLSKAAVALCIAGQMRTFRSSPVQLSILFHVLQPLRDAGHYVHVFFHVASDDIIPADLTISRSTNIFMSFAPASVTTFPVTTRCPVKSCPIKRDTACPHTLLRADECMSQVRAHELVNNVTFSWIYRTRPDIVFATNITLPSQLSDDLTVYTNMHSPYTNIYSHPWLRKTFPYSQNLLHAPVGDLIHIAPRRLASVVFSASKAFQDCHLFSMPNGTITPEVALSYWFARHAVSYRPMPWLWMLVRRFSGPECGNIPFIRTENTSLDYRYMQTCLSYKRTGVLPPI